MVPGSSPGGRTLQNSDTRGTSIIRLSLNKRVAFHYSLIFINLSRRPPARAGWPRATQKYGYRKQYCQIREADGKAADRRIVGVISEVYL